MLRGAAALLARSAGLRIVTEWSAPMMAGRSDLGSLIAWLHGDLGFRFWQIGPDARLGPVPATVLPGLPHGDLVMARALPE